MIRIVSGGQTGVDRGALDAALAARFPCGGWCPADRAAEDGPIPARYPLQELAGAGYLQRTRKNVEDSDGTLIITFGAPSGGTLRTIEFCQRLHKPHVVVDASKTSESAAAAEIARFVEEQGIKVLNVAGPRLSGWRQGHGFAIEVVGELIQRCRGSTAR